MLSRSHLRSSKDAARYYTSGAYYTDGRPRSAWWGEGAARLSLSGPVDGQMFERLLRGHLPDGTVLRAGANGSRRPGYDFTFSAPKSVSLLAVLYGQEAAAQAHERAVDAALSLLQSDGARARRSSQRLEATANLAVAKFSEDLSREQDPDLHTHAVIVNCTETSGGWRSLSNEELWNMQLVAGATYRARLASELQQLGYRLRRVEGPHGLFEVDGFSPEQLRQFSKRREQIVAAMKQEGVEGAAAAERACLRTRKGKSANPGLELHEQWMVEAAAMGMEPPVPARESVLPTEDERVGAARAAVDSAIRQLSETDSVFAHRDLVLLSLSRGLTKTQLEDIHHVIEQYTASGLLRSARPLNLDRTEPLAKYWTTEKLLGQEAALLRLLERGKNNLAPLGARAEVQGFLDRGDFGLALNEGQTEALLLALTSSDRFVGVQGRAGTGKTTMLRGLKAFADLTGTRVIGCAPSALAKEELHRAAGIESMTLQRLLLKLDRDEPALGEPQLWIVDEVSMMGTESAYRIMRLAERHDARVLFIGDQDQLPSIEAGRAFGLLGDSEYGRMQLARMDQMLRQKTPLMRALVAQVLVAMKTGRTSDYDHALDRLGPMRLVEEPDRDKRLASVSRQFLSWLDEHGEAPLAVTALNDDRRRINEVIREGLIDRSRLGSEGTDAEVLVRRNLLREEACFAESYRLGDVVRFQRSHKRLGLREGEYTTVRGMDLESRRLELETTDGRRFTWAPTGRQRVEVYGRERRELRVGESIRWTRNDESNGRRNGEMAEVLELVSGGAMVRTPGGQIQRLDLATDMHWDWSYCTTTHGAQGATKSRVLLHIDSTQRRQLGRESFWVQMTRQQYDVQVYTDSAESLPRALRRSQQKEAALPARDRHLEDIGGVELERGGTLSLFGS